MLVYVQYACIHIGRGSLYLMICFRFTFWSCWKSWFTCSYCVRTYIASTSHHIF